MKCEQCGGTTFFWHVSSNEEGWRCVDCAYQPGEPPGFSPQMDREHIHDKVDQLLQYIHDYGLLWVSNSSEGEYLVADVAEQCRNSGLYDQYTIIRLLYEANRSHGEYWKKVSNGVLSGNDPRDRCECGKLSTTTRIAGGQTTYFCNECYPDVF